MNGKIIFCLGFIVFLGTLVSGCTTTPYGDKAISREELEGRWIGDGESHLATTTTTCNINLRIGFIVKDGRAISLCSDPRCTFDVPVEENGTLRFKFRKALSYSSDYAGSEKKDINFSGQLSPEEGRGTFASGGCLGKWKVTKQTNYVPEVELGSLGRARSEFNIYLSDPKYIDFKSFSVNTNTGRWGRSWGGVSPELAIIEAKGSCEKRGESCTIYSIGNTIVSDMSKDEISSVRDEYYRSIVLNEDQRIPSESLSNIEILANLSDKTLNGVTANGLKITVHFSSNGVMKGELKTKIHGETSYRDHGNWEVSNGKICSQWTRWINSTKHCHEVYKEDSALKSYDSNGRLSMKLTLPSKD